ncbi:MAG: DUF47 domain-containing protein [Candidatus Aminicenantia bacterium]
MKFLPKGKKFFELFNEQADNLVKAGALIQEIMSDFEKIEEFSQKLSDLEHQADDVTHEIIDMLNRTFITPIDREDIHSLSQELDDIIDLIHEAVHNTILYQIKKPTDYMKEMVDVLVQALDVVHKALKSLKDFKNPKVLLNYCIEINRLENVGDSLLRKAMEGLMIQREDCFELLRWKEIYDSLEEAIDKCEDVANIIEGIVIKNT